MYAQIFCNKLFAKIDYRACIWERNRRLEKVSVSTNIFSDIS